ncbi:hypothetical protein WJX73_000285 [Symbiochloris irregularis]|uniref:Uncharacterized protein n=1 Tax=Symbiochloris irregularis TaxID=706552 RepID=A0AAW1NNJ0_9CHLO
MTSGSSQGPVATVIERKLRAALEPTQLVVTNESHLHQGHAGNPGGGPDAETHFRVLVVADQFQGATPEGKEGIQDISSNE